MGPQEDYIETVFTCEGDINDPNLQSRLEDFRKGLRDLLSTDKRKLILKKVEPWNSVRVTFNIPREAARRLKQLAQQGDSTLRQLGVLAVQIEGDQIISLTIAGRNNERTRLVFRTESDTVDAPSVSVIDSGGGTNDLGTAGPSNAETTQKNIADYLRQGAPLFDSVFGQQTAASDVFRSSAGGGDVLPFASVGMPASSSGRNPQPQQPFGFPPGKSTGALPPHQGGFFPSDQQAKSSVGQPGIKLPSPSGLSHSIPHQQGHEHSLPPPPPYPHGSALVNSFVKGGRYAPTSTGSPLLVNLLQTEPSLAGINNFMHSKMLPPPETGSPPKKKRRPRKPKDKANAAVTDTQSKSPNTSAVVTSDGEISIQSVPNPALATCGLPLVTSGSSSNMPSIPMVTQALPASTQPAVTFSGRQPVHPPHSPTHHTDTNVHLMTSTAASNVIPLSQEPIPRKTDLGDTSQFLPENTAGKIINPYTGLLEPMENVSDTSPVKSDNSVEGFSPHKNTVKRSPKEKKQTSGGMSNKHVSVNNAMHPGRMPSSDRISSVPSSSAGLQSVNHSRQQHQQKETVYSNSSGNNLMLPSSSSVSVSQSPVTNRGNSAYVQSSPSKKDSAASLHNNPSQSRAVNRSVGTEYMPVSNASQGFVTKSPPSSTPRNLPGYIPSMSTTSTAELQPLHQSVYKSLTSGFPEDSFVSTVCCGSVHTSSNTPIVSHRPQLQAAPIDAMGSAPHAPQKSENTSPSNSEQLLNAHVMNHPAKNACVAGVSNNCLVDSPGGDSENSSQSSLLHEHSAQNDITASGSLEQETKVYNHDSGIGSSSERSDGTPSEPGDDFKAAHASNDDCGTSTRHFLDGISKTCIPKSDAQVITVGYAMSNSYVHKNTLKHNSDISSILTMPVDKALNHQTFNSVNCRKDKTKVVNHVDPSHQVTVLHWSTKEKIFSNQVESSKRKSPKQFLREECMSQVMANKQKLPAYTADHLKHMQNLVKMDPLQSQHGNCISSYGGTDGHSSLPALAHGTTTVASKKEEAKKMSFSTQHEVSRAPVPPHSLNSHPINRCTSPRAPVSAEESYMMCNNDYNNITMTISAASRPVGTSAVTSMNTVSFNSSDLNSTQPNMTQFYQQKSFSRTYSSERKSKSPLVNNPMSLASNANISSNQADCGISSSGMVGCGKSAEGTYSVSHNDADVVCNGPVLSKSEPVRSVASSSSGNFDPQKNTSTGAVSSSYNKRRSPANSMTNSLSQQFFDPPLPLAKCLTESVQKLVKPLPSIDQSSLPHTQHKSPVSTASTKSTTSNSPPRLTRATLEKPAITEAAAVGKYISTANAEPVVPLGIPTEIPALASGAHDDELMNSKECLSVPSEHSNSSHIQPSKENHNSTSTVSLAHHNVPNCDSHVFSSTNLTMESTISHPTKDNVHNTNESCSGGTKSQREYDTPLLHQTVSFDTQASSTSLSVSATRPSSLPGSIPTSTYSVSANIGRASPLLPNSSVQESAKGIQNSTSESDVAVSPNLNVNFLAKTEIKQNSSGSEQSTSRTCKVTQNCNGNECNSSSAENSKNFSPGLLYNCSANNNLCTNSPQSYGSASSQAEPKDNETVINVSPAPADSLQQYCDDHTSLHIGLLENCEDVQHQRQVLSTSSGVESIDLQVQYSKVSNEGKTLKSDEIHLKGISNCIPQQPPLDDVLATVTDGVVENTELFVPALPTKPQKQAYVQESHQTLEDSSTSTMALRRNRKPSEPNENKSVENKSNENLSAAQHNLRLTRQRVNPSEQLEKEPATRQRSNTADSQDKNFGTEVDNAKNLRTSSRRRKPTVPNEIDGGGVDPSKKPVHLEDTEVAKHTRSSDIKDFGHSAFKNDMMKLAPYDTVDGITPVLDTVKTGLRNRTQNKAPPGEDKTKGVNKDPKKKPEDDISQSKKVQQSRRSRHSPTLPQDKMQNQTRDRSPVRGSRTRALVTPNTDPQEDSSKRSTRSSKPKDATETLPPPNKRRRSSRDHR